MSCDRKAIPETPLIYIVDDEMEVRQSLIDLFESKSMRAVGYASGADYLGHQVAGQASCILLDLQLPDISGLEVQALIAQSGEETPVIFLSGYGDIPATVRAMKAGATDFITKPLDTEAVIAAVDVALRARNRNLEQRQHKSHVLECAKMLTPREREVMGYVSRGLLNKQIAWEMQLSEIMVKIHRGRVMRKMEATSVADLVRKTHNLGI